MTGSPNPKSRRVGVPITVYPDPYRGHIRKDVCGCVVVDRNHQILSLPRSLAGPHPRLISYLVIWCSKSSNLQMNQILLFCLNFKCSWPFVAQAIVLNIIERMIPVPFISPGAKLGLANIITVVAIYLLTLKDAFTIVILRVILASLVGGNLSGYLYLCSSSRIISQDDHDSFGCLVAQIMLVFTNAECQGTIKRSVSQEHDFGAGIKAHAS